MERTLIIHTKEKIGENVKIQGWVQSYRLMGKVAFVDLRDRTGRVQCVGVKMFKDITNETVLEIIGEVKERPENQVNADLETGGVEINVVEYTILNKSKALPIPVEGDGKDIKEEMRLKYRYVDMRRDRMQKIMRLRSRLIRELRENLYKKEFIEVETPILSNATMEGARDFVVPSRLHPGKFYALPQSPQQYKQILMAGGIDRYFQMARCIRDEDLRADRGFEFTQLDLEISFVRKHQEVMQHVEDVVKAAVIAVGGKMKQDPFPQIDYKEAIEKYGADKFDLRTEEEKAQGILAFAWVVNFPFFKRVDKNDVAETRDGKSGWTFTHNPFSSPIPEHREWHLQGENIDKIVTAQYDLVCNGYEVGGGSVRAHESEVLRATYRIMGYSDDEIEKSVGHMIRAFELGTPPHGGIALGVDRLVMILTGESSLKETIAFPMTYNGKLAVMEGPNAISDEQLNDLGLEVKNANPKDGKQMVLAIKSLLESRGYQYEHMVHEETPTSKDSARVRGTKESEGVKAILFHGKKSRKNYLVNVPGDSKINIKAVEEVVGEKVEMEKPEQITERYGLIIGGVPPFGNLMNIQNYFDEKVLSEEYSAYNCGLRTESIKMKSKDLIAAADGQIGKFVL